MKILQLGYGAVGQENVRQLLARGHQIVGIVDVGGDLKDRVSSTYPALLETGQTLITSSLQECLRDTQPNVILQATSFNESDMLETVRAAAAGRADLVSINGIAYINKRYPALSAAIDSIARYAGIRVIGAGSIPGFLSDVLPLFLTGGCAEVREIHVKRVSDFSRWGPDVMGRYGFGLAPEAFDGKCARGEIKLFQSLWQSADMISTSLGWQVEHESEKKHGIISQIDRVGTHVTVPCGSVAGFQHAVHMESTTGQRLQIEVIGLIAPHGAEEAPSMSIKIVGNPGIDMTLSGEVAVSNGALVSSSARMVNSIARLSQATPGLRTTFDLPMIACV